MTKVKTNNQPLKTAEKESASLSVEHYLKASERKNTQRSYQAALNHYEVQWGGFLPATADQIAQYLADFAGLLSVATLNQRLAALASWHKEQGFVDPTKAPLVKKVFKGIRHVHSTAQKNAKPLQLEQLRTVAHWLDEQIRHAEKTQNLSQLLSYSRNRAMLLIGFWRGFRSDELCRMTVENTTVQLGQYIEIYLPQTKTDREFKGQHYKTPALLELCPVYAYSHWLEVSGLKQGAAFQAINRWGQLSGKALHANSLIPMLRTWLEQAGISAEEFSSHSLRRGFATWASEQGWQIKELMEYVGWKDMKSALRYVDVAAPFDHLRLDKK